jgi:hypothetical protein
MIERTTVRLPADLLDRARRRAADEGRTLTALIEDGLRLVVSEPRHPPKKHRLPRISRAVGRMLPGVDVNDGSAIQELEDIEYIERMKTLG